MIALMLRIEINLLRALQAKRLASALAEEKLLVRLLTRVAPARCDDDDDGSCVHY